MKVVDKLKKESILTIVVCVLVVVSFATIVWYNWPEDDFESYEQPPDYWANWTCSGTGGNYTSMVPIYEGGAFVYPDAYEMRSGIRNLSTGEIIYTYEIHCELRK